MCVFEATVGGLTVLQAFTLNAALTASLVASIATPVMSHVAQQQQASAMEEHQRRMYEVNKEIADRALVSKYTMISKRQAEEQDVAAQEISKISRQARIARSMAAVSAAEAGVTGLSVDNLMNDYYRKEFDFMTATQQQLRGTLFQLDMSKKEAVSEYQGRVMGATPQPVAYPSALATGISVAGGVAGNLGSMYMNSFDREILRAGAAGGAFGGLFSAPSARGGGYPIGAPGYSPLPGQMYT